jgi:hypothetical protein
MMLSSGRCTCLIRVLTALLYAAPICAQSPAELHLADGRIVEVIGLRRWPIQMIQDSLARYSPTDSLQSHACAAALRYKRHFTDASASYYSPKPGELRIVVTVREPQDSLLVKYRRVAFDTTGGRREWAEVRDIMATSPATRRQRYSIPDVLFSLVPGRRRQPTETAAVERAHLRQLLGAMRETFAVAHPSLVALPLQSS